VTTSTEYDVHLRNSNRHPAQATFVNSEYKRIIVRAGRRGGKTVGAATMAVDRFLKGHRVLYATPTSEQMGKFWFEVNRALMEPIRGGVFKKNESEHYIEEPGTERRIKAKTAFNPDMLRGDYADLLILDEWQLMNEDTWEDVGAPMLADHNGDAVFIYTPPSLRSAGISKAKDPRHAAKMFKVAQLDTTGKWLAIHFTSHENPFISTEALDGLIQDMSAESYRKEILAEDDELELSWLVYRAFKEDLCKIERFSIPETWPRYAGHDFGGANPAALFFAQVKLPLPPEAPSYLRPNDLVAYSEYLPGAGRSIPQHVDEFQRLTREVDVLKRVGGSHQEDEIRQGYAAHGWPISEPLIRLVNAQIDRVIGMMELNKIWIFTDLVRYIEELMNCLWEPDEYGRPTNEIKDKAKWHLCSAARYLLSDFTPETVGGSKPKSKRGGSW